MADRRPSGRLYPATVAFVAATVVGSVAVALFLVLGVLLFSAAEPSDPDSGATLGFAALTVAILALAAVGAALLIKARADRRDARPGARRRRDRPRAPVPRGGDP